MRAGDKQTIFEECAQKLERLLEDHWAQEHTDMVGDEEEQIGYRRGLQDAINFVRAIDPNE